METSEGTRAIALELCREFEDKFLQHIQTGEVCSALVLAYFRAFLLLGFLFVRCIRL